jgi:ABC-type dipeptide/oligopeptide/nickel transport systems, permease components
LINGYTKGVKSEGMLMVNDFAYNLPLLPILIVISYTYGITIIKFALIYALLAWAITARVSRSIALQIKEQQYVEAAKAQGASSARILLKHMLPTVMPYAFAQIALAIPGVILLEASISFLGLGDPTIATWGQILYDAQRANATLGGLWWWVIPPGLAIFFVAFTFFLVGTSLDTILNPKLRVR